MTSPGPIQPRWLQRFPDKAPRPLSSWRIAGSLVLALGFTLAVSALAAENRPSAAAKGAPSDAMPEKGAARKSAADKPAVEKASAQKPSGTADKTPAGAAKEGSAPRQGDGAAESTAEEGKTPGALRGGKKQLSGDGWKGFTRKDLLLEVLVSLLLATGLAAIIAYHPRTFGRAATLEEGDQPKIFIMYAVVGSVISEIVRANSDMALVVFGIGGLLRFRTDVGAARDTGRVILVTIVGLCCGLQIYVVAVLGTVFGWLVIYILEGWVTHRLTVKGLNEALLAQSSEAYEEVLHENGFKVMSQKKNFVKAQVSYIFRAPAKLDKDQLESLFKDIPPKLQGAVDWEVN